MTEEAKKIENPEEQPMEHEIQSFALPKTFVDITDRAKSLRGVLESHPGLSGTGRLAHSLCRDAEFAVEEVRVLRYRVRKSESALDRFRDGMTIAVAKLESAILSGSCKDDLTVKRALEGAKRALRAGKAPGGNNGNGRG